MKCPDCGTEIPEGMAYCPSCSQKVIKHLSEEASHEVLPQYDEDSVVVRPVEEREPILAPSDARPKTREEKRAMRARLRTMRIALARGIEQRGDPHLHVHDNDLSAKAAPVQPISKVKEVHLFRHQISMGIVFALIILAMLGGFYGAWSTGLIGGVTVPDVRGRSAADATAVLTDAGFNVSLNTTYVDGSAGLVVAMDPEPGERQPRGQLITVQVNEPRVIPNVVGKTYREALAELRARGYADVTVLGVDTVQDSDIVDALSPEQGTAAPVSQSITLTVHHAE